MSARSPRPAARVLLLDPEGRILLFRFTAAGRPPFWATPGGALDPGETHAEAARRELREECGIDADCGPELAQRLVELVTLEDLPVTADERYFRVVVDDPEIATHGHTELERAVMREWRWFTREEISAWPETVYPEDLIALLDAQESP